LLVGRGGDAFVAAGLLGFGAGFRELLLLLASGDAFLGEANAFSYALHCFPEEFIHCIGRD